MKILSGKLKKESGQSVVEFALILPILLLIVCGVIEFGMLFGTQLTLQNSSREGARYAALHSDDSDLENTIYRNSSGDFRTGNMEVSVVFSDADKKSGYVTVTCSVRLNALTPVGLIVFDNGIEALSSTTTMKVE